MEGENTVSVSSASSALASASTIHSLPNAAILCIGKHLDTASRNNARIASKLFKDVHAGCEDHTLYFDRHSLPFFSSRCRITAPILPCLKKIVFVFKNLVGPVTNVKNDDLDAFRNCDIIEFAFEYCDETFITSILEMQWRITFAYLWFHNGTETPVLQALKNALKARNLSFSTRFNSKQAPSLLGDELVASQIKDAHYVVHANHFQTQYGFMEPPLIISVPRNVPGVYIELYHYNVLVEHPERISHISFAAQGFNESDMVCPNRERLSSWFCPSRMLNCALEGVDIYSLLFRSVHSSTACFARQVFETLRAIRSTAVVRIYNCIESQCMALIQQFPDVFVVLVCKTDHTYLIAHLIQCYLKSPRLCFVVDESYQPRYELTNVNLKSPAEIFALLPTVLQHDWHWVQYDTRGAVV